MRILMGMFCGLLLFGCGSTKVPDGTALSDGSTSYTVTCENDWSACYTAARKICGNREFEELDRFVDGKVVTAGHLTHRSIKDGGRENEVYTENPRGAVFSRVLTIRCLYE